MKVLIGIVSTLFVVLVSSSASAQVLIPPRRPGSIYVQRPAIVPHGTGFIGLAPTESARPMVGLAFGTGTAGSGFELEVAHTLSSQVRRESSFGTFTVNFFVQDPSADHRVRWYGIGGVGLWGETRDDGRGTGGLGGNFGAGAKISLVGPLRLRVDYRIYLLNGSPDSSPVNPMVHRLYVGLNFSL